MKWLILVAALAGSPVAADVSLSICVNTMDIVKLTQGSVRNDMAVLKILYPEGPVADAADKVLADYDADMAELIKVLTAACKASN